MVSGEKKLLGGVHATGNQPSGREDELNFLPYELMQALRKKKENFPLTRLALEEFGLKTAFGEPGGKGGGKGGKGKGKCGKGIKNLEAHAFKEKNRLEFEEKLRNVKHKDPEVQATIKLLADMDSVPMKRGKFFNYLRARFKRERALTPENAEQVWEATTQPCPPHLQPRVAPSLDICVTSPSRWLNRSVPTYHTTGENKQTSQSESLKKPPVSPPSQNPHQKTKSPRCQ